MHFKEIFIFSTIFFSLFAMGLYLSLMTFAGPSKLSQAFDEVTTNQSQAASVSNKCTSNPTVDNISSYQNAYLNQLDVYQQICNSGVASKMMIFTDLILNETQISNRLNSLAENLRDFSAAGIIPVIVIEPSDNGELIDFQDIASGKYNLLFDKYFATLKSKGITDKQMGVWVPFPEPNVPNWKSQGSTPIDFSDMVNNYGTALKKVFPTTKMSILLNSYTFDPSDEEWANGQAIDFTEYIRGIKGSLVDSIGVQGFPWVSRASQDRIEQFDATDFLQPDLAIKAARLLKVKEIWFNTGTFLYKYTNDAVNRIHIYAGTRQTINNSILAVATNVQSQDYNVWINEFVQDKSRTAEATNWAYVINAAHQKAFKNMIKALTDAGIGVSLYDLKR